MPFVPHGFQLHPGQESWSVTTEILRDLNRDHPNWRVGATLHMPRQRLAYWQRASDVWSEATAFLVADPEPTRMDRVFDERGRGRDDYAYLAESDPVANPARFVRQAVRAQQAAGATAIIAPWQLHGVTQTEHELASSIRFAELAQDYTNDMPLLIGIEATEGVFATEEARNAMINELVEGPELPVYLRMRANAPAGYKPYQQPSGLAGLKHVVSALVANDRPVALPQSGLCGWLMSAAGASTFGAGMAGSMQRNSPPAGGGGGLPPLHWYFVPQMLGFALAEEMPDIARVDGFEVCDCPYCESALPGTGASFDSEAAGKHFLHWCARLASELSPSTAAAVVAQRVDAASEFASAMADARLTLDPRSQPSHLPIWQATLRG